jgi:hypothetical protein
MIGIGIDITDHMNTQEAASHSAIRPLLPAGNNMHLV